MMKKRWLITALLAACAAAQAEEPKEPVDVLRQRLAERLSSKGEGTATAKATGKAARPAKAEAAKPAHWGYAGDIGPEHWAELAPENKLCACLLYTSRCV